MRRLTAILESQPFESWQVAWNELPQVKSDVLDVEFLQRARQKSESVANARALYYTLWCSVAEHELDEIRASSQNLANRVSHHFSAGHLVVLIKVKSLLLILVLIMYKN